MVNPLKFNTHSYSRLQRTGYKYIELLGVNGEFENDKKVFFLMPYKEKPTKSTYYLLEIDDPELLEIVNGSDLFEYYLMDYKSF